ncbi:LytTR family DNA-binding domain-containing protein [Duncaniella sp.]|uniref:LytR/AlgR family response regulator transcription factor n=1 Tax=Duncaniella sp. TaxID=2518496 RepID=UPI0023C9F672|nr:LytTR family DNA-binding domain-containing protein [Duncaniella sp.]MDE5904317.1 LytTR family DNA-binding domain-containing protein [Duncaniella sp.]
MTSQKLRCVAIDDEPLALDIISKFCERFGGIELSVYSDPAEGIEVIRKGDFDLAFLDVEMEGINGLEIAAAVPPEACFIFTTAYLDYAFDGFNLNAVDYLHKPFAYDRFKLAVEKAIKKLDYNEHVQSDKCIVVKQEYNNVSIPLADIAYVEAMEGYSKIFRTDGSCTLSRVILKTIGAMLPQKKFLRIHRSFIVAVDKIRSFSRQSVTLTGGQTIPVGRQYSALLSERLQNQK